MDSMADQSDYHQSPTGTPTRTPIGKPVEGDIAVIGLSFKLPQDVDDVSGFWDVLQNRRNLMTRWPDSRISAESFVSGKQSKFNCHGGYFINDDPAAFDAPFFSISTKEAAANLSFDKTRYVEAHGTGTPVGDPIELKAIGRVFRDSRSTADPLYVGSVKTNIGHLEGSSGIAGVIKSIISLEKGIIPPHALLEKISPDIDLEFYKTVIPTDNVIWPCEGLRRVSVNSFGFGGTNAHVVLDDAYHYLQERGLMGNHCTVASVGPASTLKTNGLTITTNGSAANTFASVDSDTNGCATNGSASNGSASNSAVTNGGTTNGKTTSAIPNGRANGSTSSQGLRVGNEGSNGAHTGERKEAPTDLGGKSVTTRSIANGRANGHVNGRINGHTNGVDDDSQSTLRLLVWSAADEKALKRVVNQQRTYYEDHVAGKPAELAKLAYTLAARRSCMLWRTSAIVTEGTSSTAGLSIAKPVRAGSPGEASLAFVFTGQGAQYASMGWALVHQYPFFSETLVRIGKLYSRLGCQWDLLDELRNSENIDRPEYSQPLSTAVQVALVELLRTFHVVPKAVVGHSSGEIAAAYAIGGLSLESACKVSYFRGQLAGRLRDTASPAGAMISVNLAEDEVPAYLEKIGSTGVDVTVACINSPLNCTLSGTEKAIDAIKEQADKDCIFAQKLKTGVAYHSSAMLAIADDYKRKMGSLESSNSSSSIPMISTVTGQRVRPAVLTTAQYWVDNMVSPVRFADAVQALTREPSTLKTGFIGSITDIVEVGPTAALRRPISDTLAKAGPRAKVVRYSSVLYRKRSTVETMLELIGQLFSHGHSVSVSTANQLSGENGPFMVDTPAYPFDHSQTYWAESRISRDYRLRGAVSGETLGVRVSDWNPLVPRWRNFLSVESEPWVAGHNISNTVVYPAAGMLVMAMEAAMQAKPVNRTISGYLIKEAHFTNPIVVGETWEDRTETIVELCPAQNSYEKFSAWSDVRIFCCRKKEWTECFSSHIQVQYGDEESSLQVDWQQEEKLLGEDILRRYEDAVAACSKPVDSQVFYRNAADHGLKYGDWFQLLEDLHWDGKKTAVARIDVSKPQFKTESLVHTAVLDVVIHMLRASSQALASTSATNVPVKLVNTWVSALGWQCPQTNSIRCMGIANMEPDSGEDGAIYALGDDGKVLMSMERIVTVGVSSPGHDDDVSEPKLLHRVEWKPQLSLLDPQQLTDVCGNGCETVKDNSAILSRHNELTAIMNLALSRTLRDMTVEERGKLPASLERHMAWIEHHIATLTPSERDDPDSPISDLELEQRLQSIDNLHPSWKLHTNVVRSLKSILIGEKDPLEVIFDSNLADVFYADLFAQICDVRLRNFLDLASHENPSLRILEVGAGTGGFTGHVLAALQSLEEESGGLKLAEYTYTDISPTFFERARERWKALEGRISFKTLDLERSLESQGFEVGTYDLVVAGSVLHATADLVRTIKNVRTALKPGGRALILEVVAPEDVVVNFSFGLAPGWWLARETWRKLSPLLDEEQWDGCLKRSGYSGNDLVLRDTEEGECHICSIIVSTAVEEEEVTTKGEEVKAPPVGPESKILLVIDKFSEKQAELANLISNEVGALGGGAHLDCVILYLENFQEMKPDANDVVVCLTSLDSAFMSNMDERKLTWLQELMRDTKRLLWVTAPGTDESQAPFYSQADGVLRSLRLEATDTQIVTLDIQSLSPDEGASTAGSGSAAHHVVKVVQISFLDSPPSDELEYMVRHGLLETCRVAEDISGNASLNALLSPKLRHQAWSTSPALSLSVRTAGTLDALCFIEDTAYETDLQANDVEIEAKAWGVNFRDVLQALGRLPERTFGYDCAGIVTRVGSGCSYRSVRVGDRVCMVSPGCMRRYPRAHIASVIKIPEELDMSFSAAAAVLVPGITAYHALANVARIATGDTVLIHSAAGSTGQMAVAIAKARGAIIYATVGSEEKKQFLVNVLRIPSDHIFHSRDTSFAQAIMRVTKGRGVDVVLNSLSGDGLQASWECMARRGRFVEIGKVDISANSGLPMLGFARNVSFSAVDMREILLEDPQLTAQLLRETMEFVEDTGASPTPVHSFSADQVEQAFRRVQSGENIGRVVIEPAAADAVPQYVLDRRRWQFDSRASYLIAGGFGGIGRAIIQWMVDRGAKYLIVPSRSGASSKAASDVFAETKARGVYISAPKCDVASESAVSSMLDECALTMPVIKGCINAALVLQDAMFSNMTLPQWNLAVKAKVDTAWNLHRLLPKDLDFFVLLSSLAGIIGQMATTNYAGGCTFQDSLARHRVAHGQKGVSIDIGWMGDIGIVAETAAFQRQRLATEDMKQINGRELMALLTLCCDPSAPLITPERSQVLLGLRTPADFLAKGQTPPALLERPLFAGFSHVVGTNTAGREQVGRATDPKALFLAAADREEKVQVVISSLVSKLARAMSISPDDVELSKPLSSYGVDSLMAVELRNWIRHDFAAPMAVFDIMGGVPISTVGEVVVDRSTTGST
ncbi:related to polyketide synthase [Cephalotrichum gorgonifer]|uniref:Related to polyketide synthase n=1 Tax=Cephalotrichum gorgonifer TaxID=2041049 RepID=A0AAE8MYI9_9PEZI|nr:related to polyketide synthase [Cephalotrichum gorgonifer]